jgi:hypothetical protein
MKNLIKIGVLVMSLLAGSAMAQVQIGNVVQTQPCYFGAPTFFWSDCTFTNGTINVPSGKLYIGGVVVTPTAYTGAVTYAAMSNGLATAGAVVLSNVTFCVTNARGAVVGNVLTNLPTSAETNAQFLKVVVNGLNFVIPTYKIP